MVYSYYPGCTLKTKAKKLERYARDSAEKLGIRLEEVENWQCCGAVYPSAKDEIATRLSSVRVLKAAKEKGQDLVTVCSACHHVVKQVNHDMKSNKEIQKKVNLYLEPEEGYDGSVKVIHYLEMLRDVAGFQEIKKKAVNPLGGKKIAPYYGCLLLRPSKVMQFDDPENPTIMEDFLEAIGAKPVHFPQKNECCGGYVTVTDQAFSAGRSRKIMQEAIDQGAEAMITACPLCKYNLENSGLANPIPVYYFTELLAEALGVKGEME